MTEVTAAASQAELAERWLAGTTRLAARRTRSEAILRAVSLVRDVFVTNERRRRLEDPLTARHPAGAGRQRARRRGLELRDLLAEYGERAVQSATVLRVVEPAARARRVRKRDGERLP